MPAAASASTRRAIRTATAAEGDHSPLFMGSLAKCFQVLEALNTAGRAVGLTELAQLASLDRSGVQRITHTLRVLGYLRQDPATKAFRLSGRMLEFGHTVLATDQLRERAQPHLEALNRRTSETVNLMELEGDEIVYVARYPSLHAVSVDLHVGSRLPAFCTAAGRAILSCMEPADALARLKAARRTAMTRHTVTDLAGLRAALGEAREQGYALNNQEAFIGDVSVAAPLLDPRGHPLGAVNIAVPTPRWRLEDVLARLVPQLLKTAAAINREVRHL
ncbi:IclR family transcriptional regulator [Ramlibacter henchirensis]|uniref:IclR family transcriptional regulator n=1 Tax=Ramlibacter henchirensis TaxID=204072 RepID=A0A4Z0C5Z8_9BURK|nr:IclR family transcriptional regulator [Ramlibacter henchirensis]TFZ07197.1 IclR family transcriptional regulator [Ramlibacter henchirensis]